MEILITHCMGKHRNTQKGDAKETCLPKNITPVKQEPSKELRLKKKMSKQALHEQKVHPPVPPAPISAKQLDW